MRLIPALRPIMAPAELTPHQAWRVRRLCQVLKDCGGWTDERETFRYLDDALDLGLRRGLFYSVSEREVVGLTDKGLAFLDRA